MIEPDDVFMAMEMKAVEALRNFLAFAIRKIDDPDHSGPEDVADAVAEEAVRGAYMRVTKGDWKDL
jgi:cation transport regulator ChaB